jgi:hypothetical protein
MCLILHCAHQAEIESRCRVFWTCYVLDKSFSEEMGRPVLLRASTASTPLPSSLEADEYELWPPPSVSLGQSSRSRSHSKGNQLHIQPMKSRTITCFNATVRLAHIVEQCLDLDNELLMAVPSASTPESRQLYVMDETTKQEEILRIERQKEQLSRRLVDWWNRLDPDLRVDTSAKICPPIHFVVNCSVSLRPREQRDYQTNEFDENSGTIPPRYSSTLKTSVQNPRLEHSRSDMTSRIGCAPRRRDRSLRYSGVWITSRSWPRRAAISFIC